MNTIRIVSTSWDDGHPCDLRLAEALAKRNLSATFYVPLANKEGRSVLHATALREIVSQGFEIGAHTLSHRVLSGLSDEELAEEVRGSKQMLEEQLGREVSMFCYPRGRYDWRVVNCVRQSGFRGARTTRMLAHTLGFNRFEMPTTLQAYPHPPLNYLKNLGKRRDLAGIGRYFKDYLRCRSWVEMGKKLFRDVLDQGGIWHLYGHSWELEELGLWDQLQEMLDYVSNRPGVIYASNSRALELVQGQTSAVAEAA
ncbi:MAG: polysaccharide deacetylase family protein [Candidatus Acidiferrales bacterium]